MPVLMPRQQGIWRAGNVKSLGCITRQPLAEEVT